MLEKLYPHSWMALPATTRARLRELLNIPKTGQTDVSTDGSGISTLVSDGVTAKDLEVITVKLLQEFTGSDQTEFPRLWNIAVQKADITLSDIGPGAETDSKQLRMAEQKIEELLVKADLGTGDNSSDKPVKNEKSISEENHKE